MKKNYGGAIWTNHALERMRDRGIKQGDAWATFINPDNSRYANSKKGWVFLRNWGGTSVEVVAKKNKNKEWVIISVWSNGVELKNQSLYRKILGKLF